MRARVVLLQLNDIALAGFREREFFIPAVELSREANKQTAFSNYRAKIAHKAGETTVSIYERSRTILWILRAMSARRELKRDQKRD
jgi:hypothetical protein